MKPKREYTEAERERFREMGRRGGATRAQQFTPTYQRAARRKVKRESLVKSGRKGAQVTIERHGMEAQFEGSRKHRLLNPSKWEMTLESLLKRLGVKYVREYRLGDSRHTTDFYLPKQNLAIEVEGEIHDQGKPGYDRRQGWKQSKAAQLEKMEIPVLVIHWREFSTDGAVTAKIKEALDARTISKEAA